MAVGHLTIRQYANNIRPKTFRPTIFQRFAETAYLFISQMPVVINYRHCLNFDFVRIYIDTIFYSACIYRQSYRLRLRLTSCAKIPTFYVCCIRSNIYLLYFLQLVWKKLVAWLSSNCKPLGPWKGGWKEVRGKRNNLCRVRFIVRSFIFYLFPSTFHLYIHVYFTTRTTTSSIPGLRLRQGSMKLLYEYFTSCQK